MKFLLVFLLLLIPSPITLIPDHQFNWPGDHIECFNVDMYEVDIAKRTVTLHIAPEGMCQVRGNLPLWNALIKEEK